MSGLYNALFGTNPLASTLLNVLDLDHNAVGRFRDCYLEKRGEELLITVLTRNGGGNREEYQHVFNRLREHPMFLEEADADFDSTYAFIRFKTLLDDRRVLEHFYEQQGPRDPGAEFSGLLDALKAGKKPGEVEDPRISAALGNSARVAREIIPKVEEVLKRQVEDPSA